MTNVSSHTQAVLESAAKKVLFKNHCTQGKMAIDRDGHEYPLSQFKPGDVEYIAGEWRVQAAFPHKIQMVRDQEYVLLQKLNREEKNRFEFYRAAPVGQNCYGRFLNPGIEHVVAKYETDKETFWAYGETLEQARAFLGIRLYDEYMDVIHAAACKEKSKGKK